MRPQWKASTQSLHRKGRELIVLLFKLFTFWKQYFTYTVNYEKRNFSLSKLQHLDKNFDHMYLNAFEHFASIFCQSILMFYFQ